jgi:hypothetical protein
MASRALRNMWVIVMLKAFEAKATFEALVLVHGHRDISSNLVGMKKDK